MIVVVSLSDVVIKFLIVKISLSNVVIAHYWVQQIYSSTLFYTKLLHILLQVYTGTIFYLHALHNRI